MTITIVSVGSKPKPDAQGLFQTFLKRLPKTIIVDWIFIKHGGQGTTSKKVESDEILRAVPAKARVVLLDEKGKQLSSPELAKTVFGQKRDVVFIIGGAYGVSDEVRDRADVIWSLGMLVYPHQLVRIILAEQLYRAHCIFIGHPYHHE